MKYNQTHLSQSELEYLVASNLNPADVQRVLSAYELAASVHENQQRRDGTPYFYHSTRVCKILLEELKITDPDVICASLMHDVLEDSKTITKEIIAYNFGDYVAYVIEVLTKDLEAQELHPDKVDLDHVERLKKSSDDCLIIRLSARLDNFRCLEFDLKRNPFEYVTKTTERYIPLAESSNNQHLQYLVQALKNERNKFIG